MSVTKNAGLKSGTKHYDSYPKGEVSIFLAYAFRPFFILLPIYIILSIVLWGLLWNSTISLPFINNPLQWHIYEMIFGIGIAGIIGFILTAVPELYDGITPVTGKTLLGIVILWLLGRLTFWTIDSLNIYFVMLIHLSLLVWIIALVIKPVFLDPLQRNVSLALTFLIILLIQGWFFIAAAGWIAVDPLRILKVALGAFMVLELLAIRRISTEAINEWLKQRNIDDTFIARPPAYNIAIFTVILFTTVEFFFANNSVLAWLGLAVAAAILNTLNDYFLDEVNILLRSYILPLILILVMMAAGYAMMGFDYLFDELYGINHFRHFLTTGVFGISFFMVMVIVATIHTGRQLNTNRWVDIGVLLIIIATLLRTLIPFFPDSSKLFYMLSSLLWAAPFVIYLIQFYPWLSKPRVDGLSG